MKKSILLATAGIMAFASCQEKAGYVIRGAAEGVVEGETVYLQDFVDNRLVPLDSTTVKDGKFEFAGTPDSVAAVRYVTCMAGGEPMAALVFVEKGEINVSFSHDGYKVTGTRCNDVYNEVSTRMDDLDRELSESYARMQKDSTLTGQQRDDMLAELDRKDSLAIEALRRTISENLGNAAGVQLLLMYSNAFEADKLVELAVKIPAAFDGQRGIAELKARAEALSNTAVGKKFTDFSMDTPEGHSVKLSDFISQNEYTLIDFWASWCGPCRREMPSVVAAYKEFKAKGFGIVGVSLDNNAEQWKKAIKDLGIEWAQMSDLKGWKCEGAALYGVNSIPATVLVDRQGTIVTRGLRGDGLSEKLGELLK